MAASGRPTVVVWSTPATTISGGSSADGSGRPESLLVANGNRFAGTVTPDGRAVVFQEASSDRSGIRSMVFDSAPASRLLISGAFGESAPALSPDGKWLAYQSDETGQMQVYVRPYPGPGARVSVSLHGGTEAAWAPIADGSCSSAPATV